MVENYTKSELSGGGVEDYTKYELSGELSGG